MISSPKITDARTDASNKTHAPIAISAQFVELNLTLDIFDTRESTVMPAETMKRPASKKIEKKPRSPRT